MARARKQTTNSTAVATTPPPAKGWNWFRFDEIAINVNDRVDDPSEAGVDHYVGLEHLDAASLRIQRWGTPDEVEATKLRFRKGDIIFGRRRAYQRKLGVADFDGICSAHAMVLRANPKNIVPEMLPFFMQTDTFMERAVAISKGSLSPTINWPDLAKQQFALPADRPTQQRIASILSAAAQVVECRMSILTQLTQSRCSVIDAFLPPLKEGERKRLEDVCSMQNGRPYPSLRYTADGVRLLRPGNLSPSGKLDWSPDVTKKLPLEYLTEASEYRIGPDEVVINLTAQSLEDGFIGRVCLTAEGDDCLLNQRIGRFICRDELLPEYLFRCLQTTRFRRLVESRCVGSKIKHLYWHHFKEFEITLPADQTQKAIIDAVRLFERSIEQTQFSIATSKRLAQFLTRDLLSPKGVDHERTVQ